MASVGFVVVLNGTRTQLGAQAPEALRKFNPAC